MITKEQEAKIKDLLDSGLSETNIGYLVGCSYRVVQRYSRPHEYEAWKKKVAEANKRLYHRNKKKPKGGIKNEIKSFKQNLRNIKKLTKRARMRSEPFSFISRGDEGSES